MSIENLILGNEYTKKDLAEIFNEPNIEHVKQGISYQKAGTFLWPNLEQGFQNNRYMNVFDIEREIYEWDSQDSQDINDPRIQALVNKEMPCLLFARLKPDRPYVYCGHISYRQHQLHTHHPVHLCFNLLEIDDDPRKALQELYDWKPADWKQHRKKWDEAPKSKPIFRDSKDESYKKSVNDNKRATEIRAMKVVKDYFEDRGYDVKDVSHIPEPYHCDFLCVKDNDIRRIEVKGRKAFDGWKRIDLKPHEVSITDNDGLSYECDLFIVYDIHHKIEKINGEDFFRGHGGKLCIQRKYKPKEPYLQPTGYYYMPRWEECEFPED